MSQGPISLAYPLERPVFAALVVLNTALLFLGIWLATTVPEWLESHPYIKGRVDEVRPLLVAVVLSVPLLPLLRNSRRAKIRGNSVRIGEDQVPEIWTLFLDACGRLKMRPPELYIASEDIGGPSAAYSSFHCDYVVLNIEFLQADLRPLRKVIRFYLGRELGRIRCGHTKWWDELLISYVRHLPVVRNLLLHVRTFTHDRYGAVASQGDISGLVARAAGRRVLPLVDQSKLIEDALEEHGFWVRLSALINDEPHLSERIRKLYEAGFIGTGTDTGPEAETRRTLRHG